jgi:hypothetical protein
MLPWLLDDRLGLPALNRARSRFVVALVAAISLIAVSVVYSRHVVTALHEQGDCDLCGHFAASAGSPAHPVVPGKPVLVVHVSPVPQGLVLPARRKAGIYLPRGPPHSFELI